MTALFYGDDRREGTLAGKVLAHPERAHHEYDVSLAIDDLTASVHDLRGHGGPGGESTPGRTPRPSE